jgi:UDPglucose 6-dehydrogenase
LLCEHVGADANDVEAGLKSELRIGPKAYLKPGSAFAGGTLARDISFLVNKGFEYELPSYLFKSIRQSNNYHKAWVQNKLISIFGNLKGKRITVLGLTYKPGTDTLRRSGAVELCKWLYYNGATVKVFDPVIFKMPEILKNEIILTTNIHESIIESEAIIICTEWPEFRNDESQLTINKSQVPYIIDPNNFLSFLKTNNTIHHLIIGKSI